MTDGGTKITPHSLQVKNVAYKWGISIDLIPPIVHNRVSGAGNGCRRSEPANDSRTFSR